jgi:hypothetical protein
VQTRFRDRLRTEFAARCAANPRYSLRAFARFLRADHSTLSQILRGSRPAPARQIRAWASRMGLSREEAAAYIAAEHVPDAATLGRYSQMHHWTAEALAVVAEPVHVEILRLMRQRGFRADSRWIAAQTGAGVDEVNVAISRLMRLGLLEMKSASRWKDLTGLARLTGGEFRKLALRKIRQKAMEAS